MDLIEKVARAICSADGVDPDQRAIGLGKAMPEGKEYALWEARVAQAEAAIRAAADGAAPDISEIHKPDGSVDYYWTTPGPGGERGGALKHAHKSKDGALTNMPGRPVVTVDLGGW